MLAVRGVFHVTSQREGSRPSHGIQIISYRIGESSFLMFTRGAGVSTSKHYIFQSNWQLEQRRVAHFWPEAKSPDVGSCSQLPNL